MADQLKQDGTSSQDDNGESDRMIVDDSESLCDAASASQNDGSTIQKNDNQTLNDSVQAAGEESKDEQKTEHRERKRPVPSTVSTAGASFSANDVYEGLACIMVKKIKLECAYKKTKSKKVAAEKPRRPLIGDYVKVLKIEGFFEAQVVGYCSLLQINEYYYPIVKGCQTVVNRDGISEIITEMGNPGEGDSVPQVQSVLIEQEGNFKQAEVTTGNCLLVDIEGKYFAVRKENPESYRIVSRVEYLMYPEQQSGGLLEEQPEDLSKQQQGEGLPEQPESPSKHQPEGLPEQQPSKGFPEQQPEGLAEQRAGESPRRIQIGEGIQILEGDLRLDAEVIKYCHVIEMDGERYSIEENETVLTEDGISEEGIEMINPNMAGESHSSPKIGQSVLIEHGGKFWPARVIARNCVMCAVSGSYFEIFKVRGENWWSYGTVCSAYSGTGLMKLDEQAAGGLAKQAAEGLEKQAAEVPAKQAAEVPAKQAAEGPAKQAAEGFAKGGESALALQTGGSHPTIKVCNVFLISAGEFKYVIKTGPPLTSQRKITYLPDRNPTMAQDGGNPQAQMAQNLERPGETSVALQEETMPLQEENSAVTQEDGGNRENSFRAGENSGESVRELMVKEGETKESTKENVEERQDSEEDKGQLKKEK